MTEEDKNRLDEGRGDGGPASNVAPLPAADATGGDAGFIVVSAEELAAISVEPVVGSAGGGVSGGGGGSDGAGRPPIGLKSGQAVAQAVQGCVTTFIVA